MPETDNQHSEIDSDILLKKITNNVRWLMLIAIAATFPYELSRWVQPIIIIGFGTLFNLAVLILDKAVKKVAPPVMLFVGLDYILICFLLIISGGVKSPYIFLIILPTILVMYSSLHSKKQIMFANFAAAGSVMILAAVFAPADSVIFAQWRQVVIYLAILYIAVYYLSSLSGYVRIQREESVGMKLEYDAERKRLATLINSMAEGFLAVNAQHCIVLHNPAAAKILRTNDIDGLDLKKLLPVINKLKEPVDLGRLIESTGSAIIERTDLSILHEDQSSVKLDFSISPVADAPELLGLTNPVTHIIVIRDVTERKNLEEQREEFLSVISHELRTPIATAEADLAVLLNPKMSQLNPQSLHYATVAHNQTVFLSELVNDIASLSKLDKDTFRTKPEPFDAAQFTTDLRDEYAERIAAKKLLFRCVINENLPRVITNHNEVKEIVSNLLNNSLKYTSEGTITLSVEGSYKSKPGILFMVQDTGIGVAQSDLTHVFEKFYRSEDFRTRESGGTGLGLYLCLRLAERMKASIWGESELSRGSRFYLFIPVQSTTLPNIKQFLAS